MKKNTFSLMNRARPSENIEITISSRDSLMERKEEFFHFLSPKEKNLAQKLRNNRALEFICGRGLLREIISKKLICPPNKVQIEKTKFSKPVLAPNAKHTLFFNISHSHEALIIALSDKYWLGIDIEKIDPNQQLSSLAPEFMTEAEISEWLTEKNPEIFYTIWTQKEAALKCIGTGFLTEPNKYDLKMHFLCNNHSEIHSDICFLKGEKYIFSWALTLPLHLPHETFINK